MQSGYHNLPVINGIEQKDGEKFKAKNSNFSADSKTVKFSADIAGAYPETASVKSWLRSYTLIRGKSFTIADKYELIKKKDAKTTSNLMTYCKVSEVSSGLLKFSGDGFTLIMKYNPKVVKPVIEFKEITDSALKRYWPNGVTRILLEFINPSLKGEQEITFTVAK